MVSRKNIAAFFVKKKIIVKHIYPFFYHFEILPDAMRDFLHAIEKGYHKKNPFHNATHGGDVVQAFNVLFVWLRGSAEENSVHRKNAENCTFYPKLKKI